MRLQREADGDWYNISKERTSTLEVETTYVQRAGAGRGKKHTRQQKSWSAEVSILITEEGDFKALWDAFGEKASWRMVCEEKAWRGQAWASGLVIEANKRGLASAQLTLTGNGKLEEVAI